MSVLIHTTYHHVFWFYSGATTFQFQLPEEGLSYYYCFLMPPSGPHLAMSSVCPMTWPRQPQHSTH